MEEARLTNSRQTVSARMAVQQADVERSQAIATLRRNEALGLKVRAGIAGVLQEVPVEEGQRISPGTNLARVADPARLKAQLQITEGEVKDVAVGQAARIDTHSGIVRGHVERLDPTAKNGTVTVDVMLDEPLPHGTRPDMSVDGTVEQERLNDVLYVGRPTFGQAGARGSRSECRPTVPQPRFSRWNGAAAPSARFKSSAASMRRSRCSSRLLQHARTAAFVSSRPVPVG